MRRAAALLVVLLAFAADSGPTGRGGGLTCPSGYVGGGLTPCTPAFAFFEFAPTSGAGMGAACACAAVTSAQGGALTMTRGSTATCSKQGAATTGIANGDLVTCGANLPRVEAGTYLRESARTNQLVNSGDVTAGGWNPLGVVAAAPTTTANFGVAPDGTTTAARVQVAACPGAGQLSVVFQNYTGTAAAWNDSLYIKGNGTSGNVALYGFDSTALTGLWTSCAYVSTGWTRCNVQRAWANNTHRLGFGCNNDTGTFGGASNTGAADVLVWGAQAESGAFASSYIPTTAAPVARSADSALAGTVTATGTNFSMAATVAFISDGSAAGLIFQLGSAAPALANLGNSTNTAAAYTINATSTTPAVSAMGSSTWRTSLNDNAGTRTAFWAGGSVSAPAASMVGTATAVSIGALDARTSLVCLDPTPGRCL